MVQAWSRYFKCRDCDFKCPTSRKLEEHRTLHTGEKPHVCKIDGCKFSSVFESSLKRHLTSAHSIDKPYVCHFKGCDYRCLRADDLKRHQRGTTHFAKNP